MTTEYDNNTEELVDSLPTYYPKNEEGNNYKVLEVIGNRIDELDEYTSNLDNATSVQYSDTSGQLSEHAKLVDIQQERNESREQFRSRIIARFHLLTSEGTTMDILHAVSEIIQIDISELGYEEDGNVIFISIPNSAVESIELTSQDVSDVTAKLLPAGRELNTETTGTLFYITPEEYENNEYDADYGYDTLDEDGNPIGEGGTYSGYFQS